MYKNLILAITIVLQLSCSFCIAQSGAINPAKRPHDWWQADWKKDSLPGISLDEAFAYLKGRKSKKVIVAIIDACIDTSHEDLKNCLWTNTKEIPGNGIDDDHNGYIDDVHGWCFVCGKNNSSQKEDASDEVLTYLGWRNYFENTDTSKLTGSLKIQYAMYQLSKKRIDDVYKKIADLYPLAKAVQKDTARFIHYLNNLPAMYNDTLLNNIPFATFPFSNPYDSVANVFWSVFTQKRKSNITLAIFANFIKNPDAQHYFFGTVVGLDNLEKYDTTINYRLVVGDDDNDFNTVYGAPTIKVQGHPDWHSTLIAGIIAAN